MAKPTRIISLNLGSQTIGLAEFRAKAEGGLVLQNYRLREVLIDPAGEGIRHTQISTTLREMMAELQIRHEAVNYAVPAQSVFARFVKLPAVEEEKIERIIAFEAQQNVPFPIAEVVWDYQLIGGCTLLVDIGARTTNLVFIEPQKIFSRSVPVGGSSITVAIAKEFNESVAAAELRKKRDGFVSLGGAYAEPADPEVARVSKLMRSTMTRLHAEVMRSISHYRAQQQGNAPERVFLCGGSASTPYMREFFRQKLHVPIEFFNPLRNVAVAHAAPVDELTHSAHLLGELVGLALRSVSACPMELNLPPAVVVRRQELEKRRPFFVMAAAGVILALLGWGFYYARAAQMARFGAAKITNINLPMQAAEAKIDKLRKQAGSLDAVAAPLAAAINDRFFWTEILEDLNARLPKQDIWITELIPLSGGKPVGVDEKRAAEIAPPAVVAKSA